uniref:PCI domain-containing protein n=1 Tax=Globodera rostochiensis TaxID=31243 RepID=A0A914HWZ6_GLORO
MDEHEFMEGMEQEDEDEFVEEPMSADFDVGSINDPIAIDEPANHEVDVKPSTVNSAGIDLDLLFNDYSDYALMNRLLFIADVCPPLKVDALKMLIDYVLKRVDSAKASGIHGTESIPELDKTWVDVTTVKANSRLEALLVEFKRQKDEAVKESIRRALEDVFHQYVQMGNLQEALKLYGRGMREYCTAPNQVIQMLINWINVTAERAIVEIMERENTPTSATLANPYTQLQMTGKSGNKNQKEFVLSSKAKLLAVSGLANLQDKKFKEAAEKFMLVDLDVLNYPQLLSASDVAVYGVMCALATFNRAELKERVLGSNLFRKSLESEPKLIELLQKFCKSQFGACLDILHDLRDQLLLNIYLAPHINVLYTSIRQSAIIQYFDSYFTADINQMAIEFRTSAEQMESELVTLIERGQLKAKIDSYNKVLHAKFSDNRTDIYNRIMALRKRLDHRINAILLRAAILNHRIYEQK